MRKLSLKIYKSAVVFVSILFLISSCCADKTPATNIGVSEEYIYFEADSANKSQIIILTGVDAGWNFQVSKEAEGWLFASKSETGNNTLSVNVSLNVDKNERKGTITITSGDASKTVRVVQGASKLDKEIITESFHNGYSFYSGDCFGLGIGIHLLAFAPEGARFINPESGFDVKDGIQLIVGLTTDFYKNGSSFRIKSGKYNVSDKNTVAGTVMPGKNTNKTTGTHIRIYKDGRLDEIKSVKQGSLEIEYHEDSYVFSFEFTLDDGKKFIAEYRGDFIVRSLLLSTLAKDCKISNLTRSRLDFDGHDYISGLNKWDLSLFSDGLNDEHYPDLTGIGDNVRISVLTPKEITSGIPAGEYDICFDDRQYAAVSGFLKKNNFTGCWYINITENNTKTIAPIIFGTVEIGRAGDYYIIKLEGRDDRNNLITAAFSGIPA